MSGAVTTEAGAAHPAARFVAAAVPYEPAGEAGCGDPGATGTGD